VASGPARNTGEGVSGAPHRATAPAHVPEAAHYPDEEICMRSATTHPTAPSRAPVRAGAAFLTIAFVFALLAPGVARAATAPSLGTAQRFAVLGGSAVTNTGPSTITGDLGVSPGNAVSGFPPGLVAGGTIHSADAVALQAQRDVTTAYNALAGQACDTVLTGQDLGGLTLTPGVYCYAAAAQLTGTLTLDAQGNPSAVFIFQIGSTLTTASNAKVQVINGGSPCNIYWKVGSSATLGTATTFVGNILALTSITLTTGANISGRALARNGAVTLDTNTGSFAACTTATPTPTPTATATATATPLPTATPVPPTMTPTLTATGIPALPTPTVTTSPPGVPATSVPATATATPAKTVTTSPPGVPATSVPATATATPAKTATPQPAPADRDNGPAATATPTALATATTLVTPTAVATMPGTMPTASTTVTTTTPTASTTVTAGTPTGTTTPGTATTTLPAPTPTAPIIPRLPDSGGGGGQQPQPTVPTLPLVLLAAALTLGGLLLRRRAASATRAARVTKGEA